MTYWEERRKRLDASMAKDEKRLFAKLAAYYDREAARLDREIAAYYAKYGEQDVIAYRVLLQNLSNADRQLILERMDAFAEKYPEYAHLLPVRASIYKLNRLEGLRQSIAMQQLEMGAQEQKQAKAFFQRMALRYANASAEYLGFGKQFYSVDHNAIQRILGNAWCNAKDFSARIWENRQKLAQTLQTDFVNAFIRGDSYQRISRMMRQKFQNVSKSNMERLVFTEDTYLAAESSVMPFSQYYDRYLYECADGNACAICRALQGESFPIRDRMPGLNFPPMHPWCRCTFTIDLDSRNKNPLPAARKAQSQAKRQVLELLTSGADNGIIKKTSGAISGALNPDSERADEHAQRYYAAVRKMKTDVSKIAQNTGFSSELVQSIKDFIFMDKHDLGDRTDYFDPDYKMAESWQRLIDGKDIKPHDLTLLKHEQMERELMKQGYSQAEAHKITSKTYNYAKEAYEYYDSIEKHKGKS